MTPARDPLVTVLTAAYNEESFIREAVDSILGQSFTDFEYVIVNDGSTDRTQQIVMSFADPRIRLINHPKNIGLPLSLNHGLSVARGELIARLDANDIAWRDRLEKQARFMRQHPDVAVLGGQARAIDVDGTRIRRAEFPKPMTDIGIAWCSMFSSPLSHPAAMYRKSIIWDQLGGYNPAWQGQEDAELWMRVMPSHRIANLADIVVDLRHDPASMTYGAHWPHRTGYAERLTVFCMTNARRCLKNGLPEEWARLCADVTTAHGPVSLAAAAQFADVLDGIEQEFISAHPDGARNPEVRRFKAHLLSLAMFAVAPVSRSASARLLVRLWNCDARTALRSLPKFGAYAALKSKAAGAWGWWRARRIARMRRGSGEVAH